MPGEKLANDDAEDLTQQRDDHRERGRKITTSGPIDFYEMLDRSEAKKKAMEAYQPGKREEDPNKAHAMAMAGDILETEVEKLKKEARDLMLAGKEEEAWKMLRKARIMREDAHIEEGGAVEEYEKQKPFFDELDQI